MSENAEFIYSADLHAPGSTLQQMAAGSRLLFVVEPLLAKPLSLSF